MTKVIVWSCYINLFLQIASKAFKEAHEVRFGRFTGLLSKSLLNILCTLIATETTACDGPLMHNVLSTYWHRYVQLPVLPGPRPRMFVMPGRHGNDERKYCRGHLFR